MLNRITSVLQSVARGEDVLLQVLDETGQQHEMSMSLDAALQMVLLVPAAAKHMDHEAAAGFLLAVTEQRLLRCAPFVQGRPLGIALHTSVGLEIPVMLTADGREALKKCLRELDAMAANGDGRAA